MNYELIINDINCDLPEDFRPEYTISVGDLREFWTRGGSWIQLSTIPFTENNNRALNFSGDINSVGKFDNITKYTALFFDASGSIEVLVKIDSIDSEGYNLTLFNDIGNFVSKLENKKLSDLDFSAYDHQLTRTNQLASETSTTIPYVYDMSDRGAYWTDAWITTQDRFPAFYFYHIFKKIIEDAGYNLSSTFIETDYFKSLVFLFTAEKFENTYCYNGATQVVLTDALKFTYGLSTDYLCGLFYNNWHANINQLFASGTAGVKIYKSGAILHTLEPAIIELNAGLTLQNLAATTNTFKIQIYAQDFNVPIAKTLVGEVSKDITAGSTERLEIKVDEKYYLTDTYFTLELDVTSTASGSFKIYDTYSGFASYFSSVPSKRLCRNQWVEIANVIPDMLQSDFLKICKLKFNLFFDINDHTKTLICEPYEDFFTSVGAIDITSKIDKNSVVIEKFDKPAKIEFKFGIDSNDIYVKEAKGNSEYNVGSLFNKTIEKVGGSDSYTLFRKKLELFKNVGVKVPVLRKTDSVEPTTFGFNTRIVRYLGQVDCGVSHWEADILFTGLDAASVIYPTTYPKFCDNNWDDSYQVSGTGSNAEIYGYFTKFYKNYVKEILEGEIIRCDCLLSASNLSVLNKRVLFILETPNFGKEFFRINQIITDKSGETMSQLELIKFPFLTPRSETFTISEEIGGDTSFARQRYDQDGNLEFVLGGKRILRIDTTGIVSMGEGRQAYTEIGGVIVPAYTEDARGFIIPALF